MHASLILGASFATLIATLAFGVYLLRFDARFAKAGTVFLGIGATFAVGALAARIANGLATPGLYDGLLFASAAIAIGWLLYQLKVRTPLAGAFLTPVLTMTLYSLHVFDYEAGRVPTTEIAVVTPIHKIASYIGFLIFAIAAVASAIAIVQENRLKTKRLSILKGSRLPSLKKLESIAHRALVIGFPIYSVGVCLGAVWFARLGSATINRHQVMATVSWILYAATLHARLSIGLQGRRAAVLTLAAFVTALFVVVLSVLRLGG